ELFSRDPEVKVIHAGLECAVLAERYPGMDMVSFGPTIENAHSPSERVDIDSVARFYRYLVSILEHLV
ncbi:MAG: M20/M25/M40 family metallo-hydrolase, partial [Deltaproteobacteria bacterium]|nr:M20/M25/M40 family metallo-hydrolase [Deltaproteobacteria bacterium]